MKGKKCPRALLQNDCIKTIKASGHLQTKYKDWQVFFWEKTLLNVNKINSIYIKPLYTLQKTHSSMQIDDESTQKVKNILFTNPNSRAIQSKKSTRAAFLKFLVCFFAHATNYAFVYFCDSMSRRVWTRRNNGTSLIFESWMFRRKRIVKRSCDERRMRFLRFLEVESLMCFLKLRKNTHIIFKLTGLFNKSLITLPNMLVSHNYWKCYVQIIPEFLI